MFQQMGPKAHRACSAACVGYDGMDDDGDAGPLHVVRWSKKGEEGLEAFRGLMA